jgi:hypothetical protein
MGKTLKIIGVSLGLLVVVVLVAGYYFASSMCANTMVASSASPDGRWKVVLFERSCGATTGFSSQISLIATNKEHGNDSGNIYIAKGYPEGYTIVWESDTSVVIGGANGRGNKKEVQLNGVQVRYE